MHAVLEVFKRTRTQILMDSPGWRHIRTTRGYIRYRSFRQIENRKKRVRIPQTGKSEWRQSDSLSAVAEDILTWTALKAFSALVCKNLCYVYMLRGLHQQINRPSSTHTRKQNAINYYVLVTELESVLEMLFSLLSARIILIHCCKKNKNPNT